MTSITDGKIQMTSSNRFSFNLKFPQPHLMMNVPSKLNFFERYKYIFLCMQHMMFLDNLYVSIVGMLDVCVMNCHISVCKSMILCVEIECMGYIHNKLYWTPNIVLLMAINYFTRAQYCEDTSIHFMICFNHLHKSWFTWRRWSLNGGCMLMVRHWGVRIIIPTLLILYIL